MRNRLLFRAVIGLVAALGTASLGGCPGNPSSDTVDESIATGDSERTGTTDASQDSTDSTAAGENSDVPATNDTSSQGTGTQQEDGSVVLPPLTLTLEDGDVSGDGVVDQQDLEVLISNYGSPDPSTVSKNDLDGDGDVDITDLALLVRIITELT